MLWRCCDGLKEPAQDGGYSATASLLERQEALSRVFALTGRSAGQSPAGPPRGRHSRRVALLPDNPLDSASWRARKGQEGLLGVFALTGRSAGQSPDGHTRGAGLPAGRGAP
jgi:hypothetical protein